MKIEKNKMVSVIYELKLNDKNGETVEVAGKENPLQFVYGADLLLPSFEKALTDKKVGDKFEIEISSENGYGSVNDYMIVNIPKKVFEVNGAFDEKMVTAGNILPMMSETGEQLNGLVKAVTEDNVEMDFNHPLAGKDLYFIGEVVGVRDATEEELINELNMNDYLDFSDSCCDEDDCEGCGDDGCDKDC